MAFLKTQLAYQLALNVFMLVLNFLFISTEIQMDSNFLAHKFAAYCGKYCPN